MQQRQIETQARQFEDASPFEILSWASATWGERLAIVTSFQITGIAALHMMKRIAPRTPVLTLDTGLLFPETQDLIDELEQRFQLDLRRIKPRQTPRQQARDYGDRLWERNPDRCCHIRKTIPLRDALVGFEAWITGLRRDQSPLRAGTPVLSRDNRSGLVKVAPFAHWSEDRVWAYIPRARSALQQTAPRRLSEHRLLALHQGPRFKRRRGGRGRWANRSKSECGIHIPQFSEAGIEVVHG